jgi:hypothetical protein
MDQDVLEIIRDFETSARARDIEVLRVREQRPNRRPPIDDRALVESFTK